MFDQQLINPNPKEPNYQYNKAQYHPIDEYLITSTERLTSDTPSFVLEVTWPRVALFYHPASPLCIQLRDRYVAVAREIRRRSIRAPVEFWAVSCEVHRDACEDLGVNAVPRILAFPRGKIDGLLVPRTNENGIEVEKIIDILGVTLKDLDEEEADKKEELEEESAHLREIEERAKAANDPYRMHIAESDHMREILHPHSDLSDIFSDAMMSLLHSIDGATLKDSKGYITPWSWDQYHAFREWLDLVHWSLPTRDMAKVHNIINDLRNNVDAIEDRPDEITRILASHNYYKNSPKWSKSCSGSSKENKGYTCGFWKLLHIISIGVVEQHKSVMGDLQRVRIPHVAHAIRDYVETFGFADSKDGKELFLEAFQDCLEEKQCQQQLGLKAKGLFSRFRQRNLPPKTDKSWKELSIFLWKIHQDYRINKLGTVEEGQDTLQKVEELQWPPVALCPLCYSTRRITDIVAGDNQIDDKMAVDTRSKIIWNKEKVFEHLKHEYWPRALQSPRVVVLDRWNSKHLDMLSTSKGEFGIFVAVLFLLLFGAFAFWFFALSKRHKFGMSRRTKGRFQSLRPGLGLDYQERMGDGTTTQQSHAFQPRRRTNMRVRNGIGISAGPFLDD
jgi:hypothetical protein